MEALTLQQAKNKIAEKYRDSLPANEKAIFKTNGWVNEAIELYCQSQKAKVWEECYEQTKALNDRSYYHYEKPINSYL